MNSTVTIEPIGENTGIIFTNSRGHQIRAHCSNATDEHINTTILRDSMVRIVTTEHLMSALFGLGIDNANIILDSNEELPILDGSAADWLKCFSNIGLSTQRSHKQIRKILKRLQFAVGESMFSVTPSNTFVVRCDIQFSNSVIGSQSFRYEHSASEYASELSCARSFLKHSWCDIHYDAVVTRLRGWNQKLGEDAPLIIYDHQKYITPLRMPNEPVRHKVLDFIGDLFLCCGVVMGEFHIVRPGHRANIMFSRHLLEAFESGIC